MPPSPDRDAVLLVVGDASETLDTLYPYYRLQEAGFESVVAGPERRVFQMVMHEVRPGWTITREWEGYQMKADVAFADVDPDDYLGIFFSGGRAPEYIRYDEDLVRITRHFFAADKPVAMVCHGVEIPAYAGCLRGRRAAKPLDRHGYAPSRPRNLATHAGADYLVGRRWFPGSSPS